MVRVEDLNITFFHLPKNAGSSIATWLTDNVGGEEYMDDFRHASPTSLKPMFDDFGYSFCCVRNTWDRAVSWYKFFKKQNKITISFEDYIEQSFTNPTDKYIKPIGGQVLFATQCDYVIRYENLEEDFKIIQDKVGCDVPLFKSNASPGKRYVDFYTNDRYINMIGEYHAKEIDFFGYEFGG